MASRTRSTDTGICTHWESEDEDADRQCFALTVRRFADSQGAWYQVFSILGLEQGQPPLGEGTSLDSALAAVDLQGRLLEHATWGD